MIGSPLPPGLRAVPLSSGLPPSACAICILLEETAEDPKLILLQKLPDMRAFLGCLQDARGQVRGWVQIWVQNLDGIATSLTAAGGHLTSVALDLRWRKYWESIGSISPGRLLAEISNDPPRPVYFDPSEIRLIQPRTSAGGEWELCRDDAVLVRVGLPAYSESSVRYLWSRSEGLFVAADCEGMRPAAPPPAPEIGFSPRWQSFNPQGGPVAICTHSLLDFSDYLDLLNGASLREIAGRKSPAEAAILNAWIGEALGHTQKHGALFTGSLMEVFFLKLRAWLQAARALESHLCRQNSPLLNLDPTGLGFHLPASGDLPWAWTVTCELTRPGRALRWNMPGTGRALFLVAGEPGRSPYCPPAATLPLQSNATLMLLEVNQDQDGRVTLEGNLQLPRTMTLQDSDILCFSGPGLPGEFFGTLMARTATRIRTWPRDCTPAEYEALRRHKGSNHPRCACIILPALSSPYDFNSVAILGARALLCSDEADLPETLLALENLGRQITGPMAGSEPLQEIAAQIRRSMDANQLDQHLQPPEFMPASLWSQTLAILLRLMPGLGPVSLCADFSEASSDLLHAPLEAPLLALEKLCSRARSLLMSDFETNSEVRAVLAILRSR